MYLHQIWWQLNCKAATCLDVKAMFCSIALIKEYIQLEPAEMLNAVASSCFSRKVSVSLQLKRWQLSTFGVYLQLHDVLQCIGDKAFTGSIHKACLLI